MQIPTLLGRGGFARCLGVTEQMTRLLRIPPDYLVDGRPAWTSETAARVKAAREAKQRNRSHAETSSAALDSAA